VFKVNAAKVAIRNPSDVCAVFLTGRTKTETKKNKNKSLYMKMHL
jgi:hypothetical protein